MTTESTFERVIRERRERKAAEEAAVEAARIAAEEQRHAMWGDVPVGLEDLFDPDKQDQEADYVDRAQKYFIGAVESSLDEMLHCGVGRNDCLNNLAFQLGRLSAGLDIPWHGAAKLLEKAALKSGLTPYEVKKTIQSGFTSGLKQPRGLPDGR